MYNIAQYYIDEEELQKPFLLPVPTEGQERLQQKASLCNTYQLSL
jgi:hypothetical protein